MKKFIFCGIALMLCIGISGCVWSKILVVKVKGDKIKAPIGGYNFVEGEKVDAVAVYQSFLTDEKGRTPPPIPDIHIIATPDNTGSVEVKK